MKWNVLGVILPALFMLGCLDQGTLGKLEGAVYAGDLASTQPTPTPNPSPLPQPEPAGPPLYQFKIDTSQCVTEAGFSCLILKPNMPEPSDSDTNRSISKIKLFENGKEIGPAHSLHDDIRFNGQGRFSHWLGTLRFSASDNSNPLTNGKTYTFGIEGVYTAPEIKVGAFNNTLLGGDQITLPVTGGEPPLTYTVTSGGGSVNALGVYTAPTSSSRITVRVTDKLAQYVDINLRSQVLHYIGGDNGTGSRNTIYSSHDGKTWTTSKPLPLNVQGISLFVLNDVLHLFGGYTTTQLPLSFQASDLAGNWTQNPNLPRTGEMAGRVLVNGKIYLAATDQILVSSDGVNFTKHANMPYGPDIGTRLAYFNGKFVLTGGYNMETGTFHGFVMTSPDAKTWTYDNDIPPRFAPALFTFNNKLYLAGGQSAQFTFNSEVFESTDGIQWTKIGNLPAPRAFLRGIVFRNMMYLVGGKEGTAANSNVWASSDGVNWTTMGSLPGPIFNGDLAIY